MEEKEKWTVPTENVEEKPKNLEEKEEKSEREKIADYVISRLPDEIQSQINSGKSLAEILSMWENYNLKRENRNLKVKLEKFTEEPISLESSGGEGEKNPFAAGFMLAMEEL